MKINNPNKLSIIRVLLVPVFMLFYLQEWFSPVIGIPIAVGIYLFAEITDFLDGYLARKHNEVTTLGVFLDTIADKILCTIGIICIVMDGTLIAPYGIIFLSIIISRDLIVSAVRTIGATKGVIIAAKMSGKIKANVTYITIIAGFVVKYLGLFTLPRAVTLTFEIIFYIGVILTTLSTIYSGAEYVVRNRKLFTEEKKD